jgi:hypothetical protein
MNNTHTCLVLKPNTTDWKLGSIPLKSNLPSGNWLTYTEFFERQQIDGFETDGCVCFSTQESFDAQMEFLIQTGQIPATVLSLFTSLGYMDSVNSTDKQPHFHTSPRFLQIQTGNGYNGNSVPDAANAIRKYGCLPWTDMPFDATITQAEYLTPPSQDQLNKASQFLAIIGGAKAVQYFWVCDGTENLQDMKGALTTAPLLLGVNVGTDWNVVEPPAPVVGSAPGHCVMGYYLDEANTTWIFDHYIPNPKGLTLSYPIQYVLQMILSPIFPPPAPTLPPNPTVPQEQSWLDKLVVWLQNILQ